MPSKRNAWLKTSKTQARGLAAAINHGFCWVGEYGVFVRVSPAAEDRLLIESTPLHHLASQPVVNRWYRWWLLHHPKHSISAADWISVATDFGERLNRQNPVSFMIDGEGTIVPKRSHVHPETPAV